MKQIQKAQKTPKNKEAKPRGPLAIRIAGTPMESQMQQLAERTGLPQGELVRRACEYAFPKYLSGEIAVISLKTA